jgi:molybdate transport system substrate-binding protein
MASLSSATASEAVIAVATNFSEAAEALRGDFETGSDHRLTITTGSTGKLYAQIINGAPFDALLAADRLRPERLEQGGEGVAGTRFVYAEGRLTLWSIDAGRIGDDGSQTLLQGDFGKLAIANPALAPYGLAAQQALKNLGLWDSLRDRIVMGENIGQTYALVATRNADLGLVALSSVKSPRNRQRDAYWLVPERLHDPIHQEAILLKKGADNDAALAFLAYLKTDTARMLIDSYGYGSE